MITVPIKIMAAVVTSFIWFVLRGDTISYCVDGLKSYQKVSLKNYSIAKHSMLKDRLKEEKLSVFHLEKSPKMTDLEMEVD